MTDSATRAGMLFDYAVVHADGFTVDDAAAHHHWHLDQTREAIRALRLILADDTINLVCDPGAARARWTYRLVGTVEDAKGWAANRLNDLESRLGTIESMARTLTNGTDGRTVEGRRARKIYSTIAYLRGELADLDGRLYP